MLHDKGYQFLSMHHILVSSYKLEHPPLETAEIKHLKIHALIPAVLVGAAGP